MSSVSIKFSAKDDARTPRKCEIYFSEKLSNFIEIF